MSSCDDVIAVDESAGANAYMSLILLSYLDS